MRDRDGDALGEVDGDDLPADDCLNLPGAWGTVVFDALTGRPMAVLEGASPLASADADADGVSEIIVQRYDATGLEDGVAAYELACSGPDHATGWSSCAATGCTLEEQWSVAGSAVTFKPQVLDPVGPACEIAGIRALNPEEFHVALHKREAQEEEDRERQ